MDDIPNLRKLAARSLNKSCKQFLGDSSQCDLMSMKFEQGDISFDDYLKEMEGVFMHHTPVEPVQDSVLSVEEKLKKLLEK